MTTQTIALAGGAVLMLLVLLVLRRRRAAGAGADEEVERPTPLLALPTSLPAADDGAHAHMGPPAPEPMEWPPFPPSAEAVAASEAAAVREPTAEPAGTRRAEPEPARAWAPGEVIDEPGWPTPGEMDMGWAPAMAGAAPSGGAAAHMNGNGNHYSADGPAPPGLLSDSLNGFDPAAGWSDDPASGETAELERVADPAVADHPPLDWAPPEDEVDRAWAAFANDEPVPPMASAAPEEPHEAWAVPAAEPESEPAEAEWRMPSAADAAMAPSAAEPEPVAERVWEMPAPPAPEPEVAAPEPAPEPVWAMPAPEPVWAMPAPENEVAPEAEAVPAEATAPEPPPLAVVPDPEPAPLPVPEPTLHVVAEPVPEPHEAAPELAWFDEPLPEPDPEAVAWWDEPDSEAPEVARETGAPTTGRFALGGFALQPGNEALTGVTFRAPLAAAPERWELAGEDPVPSGTLVLELDGALNCDAADLAVLTAAGFAPTPEGFTLRVAARASGPFAASGTFRIAA